MPVGSFEPNPFGLYDMHGNVWEACLDYYRADLSEIASYVSKGEANAKNGTQLDGTSGGGYTVVRGGAWDSDSADLRSARRKNQYTWDRAVGVRIVCPARID